MYFIKTYKTGAGDYDPRQKQYALFGCSNCNKEEDVDITFTFRSFDFEIERKCPHCRSYGKDDYKHNLKAKIQKLTNDKERIQNQIERLIEEVDTLNEKELNAKC